MRERGVHVDHATIQRGVITYSPLLEEAFHRRKRLVWVRWRREETYLRVEGEWRSLDRAVAKHGPTMDFLRTEHREQEAARRLLKKAIRRHGIPETITKDGRAANAAALRSDNEAHGSTIIIRQVNYLHNMLEQDHRGVKRITGPMRGFKSLEAAQDPRVGIELMHRLKKRQVVVAEEEEGLTAAEQFSVLVA